MYKILINTTERFNKSVELINTENNKTIDRVEGDIDTAYEVQQIILNNNIEPHQIEEIQPNTGPGSFTGIKIGVTIANIFNWATKNKGIENSYKPNYGKEPNIQPPKKESQ